MSHDFATYLSENDLITRVQSLQERGLSFRPTTLDELVLSDRLCERGVLSRNGAVVHLSGEKARPSV